MRERRVLRVLLGAVLAASLAATAVARQEPLTNGDIARLIAARVPTDTVVRMVAGSPEDFDISFAALAALQAQGVPDVVLRAMVLRVRPPKEADGTVVELPDVPQPVVGSVSFVYERRRIELLRAAPVLAQSGSTVSAVLNPFAKPGLVQLFAGGRAAMRIAVAAPAFQVELPGYLAPGDAILLVRLEADEERRQLSVDGPRLELPDGVDEDAIVPVHVAPVSDDAFRAGGLRKYQVETEAPLPPGEYALLLHGALFYDFGIDEAQ